MLGFEEQIMFYVHSKLRIPEKAIAEHDVHFILNKFFIFQSVFDRRDIFH